MKCSIIAVGTRGDVEPLIAVGAGLKAAGVDVRMASQHDYAEAIKQRGLEYFQIEGFATGFYRGSGGVAFRERLRSKDDFQRFFDNYLSVAFGRMLNGFWAASQDADVVLCWLAAGPSIAERLKIPVFVTGMFPVPHLPTGAFPNPYQGLYEPGSWLWNRRSWRANEATMAIGEGLTNKWRDSLGLPSISAREDLVRMRRMPHLLGYSPSVLPRPRDWHPDVHVTGYWFLESPVDYQPPPALQTFLDAGPPPIAVGFSSQVGRNAGAITDAVVEALARTEQRAVLVTWFGGLKDVALPDSVYPVLAIPYTWLFPRISAMVHHGGSGSTAVAMRAGLPQLGVPFGFDQPLWAGRIQALGVGPAPIPAESITADRLTTAFREMTSDPRMRERGAEIGAAIRAEDGVGNAVKIILEAADRRNARVTTGWR